MYFVQYQLFTSEDYRHKDTMIFTPSNGLNKGLTESSDQLQYLNF